MTEFRTPTAKKCRSRIADNPELLTPIRIPASPFLQKIGYGCGVNVFTLERSPKVGFTRSPWAIKKRNNRITKDEEYNDRIVFEGNILSKLNHPNIVGFRGMIKAANGEPCLAMEKLEISLGDMIEDRLNSGDDMFPASTILKVEYEIVKALEYLHHTAHILHGDIKSYNVLVSKNLSIVKLCDFGVSAPLTDSLEIDTSTKKFSYVGTECWSAPEIIFEEGPVTNKCDIWSFGLIAWEMIALSPPHVQSSDDSAMESCFEDSILKETDIQEIQNLSDSVQDESIMSLHEISKVRSGLGTRPPLPAVDLGLEYQKVLELFYACTTVDYKLRPSAKGIVMFFENTIYKDKK